MSKQPRIAPLAIDALSSEQQNLLEPWKTPEGRVFNLFLTFVKHPDMLRRWYPYGMHVMLKSTLPTRDRELVIMRTAWLNDANYEWGHHRMMSSTAGVTDEDLRRVTVGANAQGWNDFERLLMTAVDELKFSANLTDETYEAITRTYNEQQIMDLVHTWGAYNLVSTLLNVTGVELEEDVPGLADFK